MKAKANIFYSSLYMMQKARDWSEPVGFLDPHVVFMQTIEQDASFVEKYITAALLCQNNKDYIVVPFNQGSFIAYVANEGLYNGLNTTLTHRTRFSCCQQKKNDELCGFYVCHHMRQIIIAKMKDIEDMNIDLDALVAKEIVDVRGKLCAFIKTDIINPTREFDSFTNAKFHPVDTSQPPVNN